MTIYYIDHVNGSDANSGLSWTNAWATPRALREHGITPGAGDELRFAETPHNTDSTYYYDSYTDVSLPAKAGVSTGSNTVRGYVNQTTSSRGQCTLQVSSRLGGTMVAGAAHGLPYTALNVRSASGQFNAPSTTLLTAYISDFENSGYTTGVFVYIRVSEPYAGVNARPVPAGTLEVRIMSTASVMAGSKVVDVPIPMDGTYARVFVEWATIQDAWRLDVIRTAQPLDWDNSPISLTFAVFNGLPAYEPKYSGGFLLLATRDPVGTSARYEEVCGADDMTIIAESVEGQRVSGIPFFIKRSGTSRIPSYVDKEILPHVIPDLDRQGQRPHYPEGAVGAYDLNGSLGGVLGIPLTLSGGWSPATGLQTGYTIYSAQWHYLAPAPVSLFDIGNADHVVLQRLGACNGFQSLFTRARTLELDRCYLGVSLGSAFGETTEETHVTIKDMYLGPETLNNIGVMGDLTLIRSHHPCETPLPEYSKTLDVRNFVAEDSFSGLQSQQRASGATIWNMNCRGDATLTNCTLAGFWGLYTDRFGNKLRFIGHKDFNSNSTPIQDIEVGNASPWDSVSYEFEDAYRSGTYTKRNAAATMTARFEHWRLDRTISDNTHRTADKFYGGIRLNALNTFVQAAASSAPTEAGFVHGVNIPLTSSGSAGSFHANATAPAYIQPRNYVTVLPPGGTKTSYVSEELPHRPAGFISLCGKLQGLNYRKEADTYITSWNKLTLACLKTFVLAEPGRYRIRVGINQSHWRLNFSDGSQRLANTMTAANNISSSSGTTEPMQALRLQITGSAIVGEAPSVTLTETAYVPYYAMTSAQRDALRHQWEDVDMEFEVTAASSVDVAVTTLRAYDPVFVVDEISIERLE